MLELDPTAVSKEIKRNRIIDNKSKVSTDQICKKTDRFPFVCNACPQKYTNCPFIRCIYDPRVADKSADERLVMSRRGINMTEQEYETFDSIIKQGVNNKESIYHILKSNPDLDISTTTTYRWINEGRLSIRKHHLPYATTYKKSSS